MKIKNTSGEDRMVPWLNRLVMAGQVVEVNGEDVWAFTQQAQTWAPADDEAQVEHDKHAPEKPKKSTRPRKATTPKE